MDCHMQNCVGGACLLGSIMGFKLDMSTPFIQGEVIIQNLLRSGCGFVASGGRIVALLNQRRAYLPLNHLSSSELRKPRDRLKDVQRILRTKLQPHQQLSLRFNTNFDGAITALLAHHQPCWISPELTRIWKYMYDNGRMITCELWLRTLKPKVEPAEDDSKSSDASASASSVDEFTEELIACDIGFPLGYEFYVATRFSERKHKLLAPVCLFKLLFLFCSFSS